MADYTPEQRDKIAVFTKTQKTIATLMKEKKTAERKDIENILYAWVIDRNFFKWNSTYGTLMAIQTAAMIGDDPSLRMKISGVLRDFDAYFDRIYPGLHREKTEKEAKIFSMAIEFLRALEVAYDVTEEGLQIHEQTLIHFVMLHNYDKDVDLFCYSEKLENWVIHPVFFREIVKQALDEHETGARFKLISLATSAAEYCGEEGHNFDIPTNHDDVDGLFVPYEWIKFCLEATGVLEKMRRTAPDKSHFVWLDAAISNLNKLMKDSERQNALSHSVLLIRYMASMGLTLVAEGQEDDNAFVEELERSGLFTRDRCEKKTVPAKTEPLSHEARDALLEKLSTRWKENASSSEATLEAFTVAVHAEFGSSCQTCMSAPRQVIYKQCGHTFMCEECFRGGYKCSGECPVCRTHSDTVFLLVMPSNQTIQETQPSQK